MQRTRLETFRQSRVVVVVDVVVIPRVRDSVDSLVVTALAAYLAENVPPEPRGYCC